MNGMKNPTPHTSSEGSLLFFAVCFSSFLRTQLGRSDRMSWRGWDRVQVVTAPALSPGHPPSSLSLRVPPPLLSPPHPSITTYSREPFGVSTTTRSTRPNAPSPRTWGGRAGDDEFENKPLGGEGAPRPAWSGELTAFPAPQIGPAPPSRHCRTP